MLNKDPSQVSGGATCSIVKVTTERHRWLSREVGNGSISLVLCDYLDVTLTVMLPNISLLPLPCAPIPHCYAFLFDVGRWHSPGSWIAILNEKGVWNSSQDPCLIDSFFPCSPAVSSSSARAIIRGKSSSSSSDMSCSVDSSFPSLLSPQISPVTTNPGAWRRFSIGGSWQGRSCADRALHPLSAQTFFRLVKNWFDWFVFVVVIVFLFHFDDGDLPKDFNWRYSAVRQYGFSVDTSERHFSSIWKLWRVITLTIASPWMLWWEKN